MKANEKVQVKVLKRRIEQLLNGIFEYETPKLQISEDKIEAKVREGKQVRGSFSLENPAQKKVKGFIYAESPRVAFEPAAFSAISEKVIYEIDTTGMEKGDVLEGKLTMTETAIRAGFTDPNYFSKVFHKIKGCSPRSYRKTRSSPLP